MYIYIYIYYIIYYMYDIYICIIFKYYIYIYFIYKYIIYYILYIYIISAYNQNCTQVDANYIWFHMPVYICPSRKTFAIRYLRLGMSAHICSVSGHLSGPGRWSNVPWLLGELGQERGGMLINPSMDINIPWLTTHPPYIMNHTKHHYSMVFYARKYV